MQSRRLSAVVCLSVAVGFLAGLPIGRAASEKDFQQTVNKGLTNATNSVLGNLLGRLAGGAMVRPGEAEPPDPVREAVVLDFSEDSQVPVLIRIYAGAAEPPEPVRPCRTILQVSIDGMGGVTVDQDPVAQGTRAGFTIGDADLNTDVLPLGPCAI